MLPADMHVHTEWSWDAVAGSMDSACRRASELDLTGIAFADHADLTEWVIGEEAIPRLPAHFRARLRQGNRVEPPELDVAGYAECVRQCRKRFPGLRIRLGVELSEPHWHTDSVAKLRRQTAFDVALAAVHSIQLGDGRYLTDGLARSWSLDALMREYLAEVLRLALSSADFDVLSHIDYPLRMWPSTDVAMFEEEFRAVLGALADSGRALEINTKVPLHANVIGWWREAGGTSVCLGSDAHEPTNVGRGFVRAAAIAEMHGFVAGRGQNGMLRLSS